MTISAIGSLANFSQKICNRIILETTTSVTIFWMRNGVKAYFSMIFYIFVIFHDFSTTTNFSMTFLEFPRLGEPYNSSTSYSKGRYGPKLMSIDGGSPPPLPLFWRGHGPAYPQLSHPFFSEENKGIITKKNWCLNRLWLFWPFMVGPHTST